MFKNLAVDKKKDPPKQADLFSDAVHLDRYVNNKYVQNGPPKVSYFTPIATNYWLLFQSQPVKCTEVRFASFFSGGLITAIVVNPPERKLAKCTSVQCLCFHY